MYHHLLLPKITVRFICFSCPPYGFSVLSNQLWDIARRKAHHLVEHIKALSCFVQCCTRLVDLESRKVFKESVWKTLRQNDRTNIHQARTLNCMLVFTDFSILKASCWIRFKSLKTWREQSWRGGAKSQPPGVSRTR